MQREIGEKNKELAIKEEAASRIAHESFMKNSWQAGKQPIDIELSDVLNVNYQFS